ncbi:MAG: hypothetical protein JJ891_11740 [Rhizobiaceae bacterium]|nr:hypothetical protein [Rhizobiaceae bacterium]
MKAVARHMVPFLLVTAVSVFPAFGQQAATDVPTSETDPVLIFNRICYAQVPVVRKIEALATRFAWNRMGKSDVRQFTSLDDPDYLAGWDVNLAKRLYRLGVVQSEPSAQFKQNFPEFADGEATACTLVLDGADEWDVVLGRMNSLIGKKPASSEVPDGGLLTTTWAGGNNDFKVFVFAKATPEGKATLLNVTILSKEKV